MPEPEPTLDNCHACGNAMDVSAVAPFSNVECPTCRELNRVKRKFGHYTLTRRLAEGGMSLVFVAMDNTLGREVALKILNEDYSADERRIQAFEEEARITASFTHPNVVRVFTTGRAFGRFYIAMELVPGGHFEHQIRERGEIPEAEILPFAVQVAEGLEAARAAGLIHRDVKPGNILLDSRGNAKIVDFGLALVTKGGSATAQEIWATPYYVPPETIEGHAEDFRSDLYAFGATLYHALAGTPPCDEQSMATDVLRQAKRHVKALKFAAPHISEETCAIIDRAMAYDRNARFSSYAEMISQLKASASRLKNGGVDVASGRLQRRASARRGEWIAIGAAALVLLGAIGGGIAWVMRKEEAKKPVEAAAVQVPEMAADPGTATLIGQRYRDARAAVEAGDYEKARHEFSTLRDDAEVQEPTRTWAAVEAVVVTYLDGRAGDARKEAEAAQKHIESAELAEKKLAERLLRALKDLDGLEPIVAKDLESSEHDAAWTMAVMLGGLKNWEQGITSKAAADFFKPISAAKFRSRDQWVTSYQKIAKAYLDDSELLDERVFEALPETKEACSESIETLEKLLPKVKTKGRARFNIRALQLDLARKIKLLDHPVVEATTKPEIAAANPEDPAATKPPTPEPVAEDPLVKIAGLSKACRFSEAAEFAKSLAADPAGATRESLAAINTSAANFLTFLENEITAIGGESIQLKLRSGGTLDKIKVTKPGVLSASGAEHPWGEIDPESVIQLYRTSIRIRVAEIDRIPRHEGAIAFDWLVGDRARAAAAADRLALESPIFKRRWDSMVSGFPK